MLNKKYNLKLWVLLIMVLFVLSPLIVTAKTLNKADEFQYMDKETTHIKNFKDNEKNSQTNKVKDNTSQKEVSQFVQQSKSLKIVNSDPNSAPLDWAFEVSSVELNDFIINKYPSIDIDGDGFISISEAHGTTGDIDVYGDVGGTLNGIENFINISQLSLGGNLEGKIPLNIGNLKKLERMFISGYGFTGTIPSSIGDLENLELLSINETKIEGEIPNSIGNLAKLKYLSLRINNLSGSIPSSIGDLTNLEELDLLMNELSGEIPSSIGNLNNLKSLDISDNKLSGKIPSEIAKLTNLTYLSLYYNELSGSIPQGIGELTQLEKLHLHLNNLSGEIPTSIGKLTNLKDLFLYGNHLEGEIPLSITNLKKLDYLRLNSNNFTSIPETVFEHAFNTNIFSPDLSIQSSTKNLTKIGTTFNDYVFEGIPAYEQFPNYGMVFTWWLDMPDGTNKIVTPIIKDGKVTISGNDLTQEGSYILLAGGQGGKLRNVDYTTKFSIAEKIEYISAKADGIANKQTSTKITITLSKDIPELSLSDITLSQLPGGKVNKEGLISLGNGIYELEISGEWKEGDTINVTISKEGYVFTPDTHTTILHKKLENNDDDDNNNNNNDDNDDNHNDNNKNKQSIKLPKTGSNNISSLLILTTIILILGQYLFTKIKE